MKSKKFWSIFLPVILLLQLAVQIFTLVKVFQLNILPDKYAVAFIAAFAFVALFTAALMFVPVKKKVGTWRKILACILAVLVIVLCGVVAKVVGEAYQTIHAVTGDQGEEATDAKSIYVFVRTEDPAQTLKDTAGYRYAILQDYNVANTQQALLLIEEEIQEQLEVSRIAGIQGLADALFSQQVDALVLNGVSVALLTEEEGYADFMDRARILDFFSWGQLQQTVSTTEPENTQAPQNLEGITQRPFVVYISGSDTREKKLRISRSDVNILAVVNPTTKQVLLLNTPRDYYVPNPAGDGALDKLTHCGIYGTSCSMEALEGLYEVKIDHYAQINFTGFETLVDAVGGIRVYADQSFKAGDMYIQKGWNDLNGEQALWMVRERYHVAGGDNGRGKNQMKAITALIDKMTSGSTIISNYSAILNSLEGLFKTSVTSEEISQLVKMQLTDMAKWNVQSYAVIGTGGSERTYSAPGNYAYVMHPNQQSVDYAKELVNRVMAGETLTAEDMKLPE